LERDGRSESAAFCRRWRIIVSMGTVRERIFSAAIFAKALSDFQGFNFGSLSRSVDNCRVGFWQVTCKCSPLHMGWFNLCPNWKMLETHISELNQGFYKRSRTCFCYTIQMVSWKEVEEPEQHSS
jgi:hypothetical protein